MPELMGNARSMLAMCASAAEGALDEGQQAALAAQIVGAFAAMPVIGGNIVALARDRDWYGLVGAISSYIDVSEASSRSTAVTATSSATASVRLDLSVFFDIEEAISLEIGLTDSCKDELGRLLREMAVSAQKGDAAAVSDKLRKYLELGANAVTVMTWLGPLLMQLGTMLAQHGK